MQISATEVNELRKQTGAGLMDCKKALTESGGDFDKAIDFLRKKGQKVSALRAGKDANEGVSIALTNADKTKGVVIKLKCETDFVAKNEDFVKSAQAFAKVALDANAKSLDDLLKISMDGTTVKEKVDELVGTINERIELSDYHIMESEGLVEYIHANNKIAVLVALNVKVNDAISEAGKDVAMQIAAMNPVAVDKNGVDASIVERELEVGREQAKAEGKPDNIIDKIATGKLEKFYKENTLLNQPFVKDGNLTVGKFLQTVDKNLTVKEFKRIS
ncbi:MAG: elongation factor Ts [Chitinophagaceae bacterium]|nr:MAG: elongation factor Ts [Chitinophagaceae bacterium]